MHLSMNKMKITNKHNEKQPHARTQPDTTLRSLLLDSNNKTNHYIINNPKFIKEKI